MPQNTLIVLWSVTRINKLVFSALYTLNNCLKVRNLYLFYYMFSCNINPTKNIVSIYLHAATTFLGRTCVDTTNNNNKIIPHAATFSDFGAILFARLAKIQILSKQQHNN
jgi:hypothetical protein